MTTDQSLWVYFTDASLVVKTVMTLLFAVSVISWTMIFQRASIFKKTRQSIREFEESFWSGTDLNKLYAAINSQEKNPEGLESIFHAGFREFVRLRRQSHASPQVILEGTQRVMRVAYSYEMEKLEQNLSFLATVGCTSPYVGLFGTVWGIMASFHALANAQSATIPMVAPGISEALLATAMGLFAAIPAVVAYNRFSSEVERLLNQYETFQEEFSSILYRQLHMVVPVTT